MTRYQIRMTFAYPELLSHQAGITERIAAHPTRPARETDANCWWEDVSKCAAFEMEYVHEHDVRFAPATVSDMEPDEVNRLMKIHPLPERWMDGAQVF